MERGVSREEGEKRGRCVGKDRLGQLKEQVFSYN